MNGKRARRIRQLEAQQRALRREKSSAATRKKLDTVGRQLAAALTSGPGWRGKAGF